MKREILYWNSIGKPIYKSKKTVEVNLVVNDFARKIAKAMKEISSSHVYFIVQQAYGDIDWDDVVKILDEVIKETKP